jgi:hypothetical protein
MPATLVMSSIPLSAQSQFDHHTSYAAATVTATVTVTVFAILRLLLLLPPPLLLLLLILPPLLLPSPLLSLLLLLVLSLAKFAFQRFSDACCGLAWPSFAPHVVGCRYTTSAPLGAFWCAPNSMAPAPPALLLLLLRLLLLLLILPLPLPQLLLLLLLLLLPLPLPPLLVLTFCGYLAYSVEYNDLWFFHSLCSRSLSNCCHVYCCSVIVMSPSRMVMSPNVDELTGAMLAHALP